MSRCVSSVAQARAPRSALSALLATLRRPGSSLLDVAEQLARLPFLSVLVLQVALSFHSLLEGLGRAGVTAELGGELEPTAVQTWRRMADAEGGAAAGGAL